MAKAKDVQVWSAALLAAGLLTARVSAAQETPPSAGPGVGAVAPSFSLPGGTPGLKRSHSPHCKMTEGRRARVYSKVLVEANGKNSRRQDRVPRRWFGLSGWR